MTRPLPPPLSVLIDAVHPVFLLVMGIALVMVAWRLALTASVWSARLLVVGSLLLGFGYAVLMPLHETGWLAALVSSGPARAATADLFGWNAVTQVVMNGGWLLFGIGMALHAKVWRATANQRTIPAHPIP